MPTARPDRYRMTPGESLSVSVGVLDNDFDIDGHRVAIVPQLTELPDNGELTMALDGTFVYVPNPDFTGIDNFTYTIHDGAGGEATGTVSIVVGHSNSLGENSVVTLDRPTGLRQSSPTVCRK